MGKAKEEIQWIIPPSILEITLGRGIAGSVGVPVPKDIVQVQQQIDKKVKGIQDNRPNIPRLFQ
jgi:hypothetical protein